MLARMRQSWQRKTGGNGNDNSKKPVFEEFFEILTLKQLCRHNKPIAIYNLMGYYDEINHAMEQSMNKNFIRDNCKDLYLTTENLEELFSYIENPEKQIRTVKELKDG